MMKEGKADEKARCGARRYGNNGNIYRAGRQFRLDNQRTTNWWDQVTGNINIHTYIHTFSIWTNCVLKIHTYIHTIYCCSPSAGEYLRTESKINVDFREENSSDYYMCKTCGLHIVLHEDLRFTHQVINSPFLLLLYFPVSRLAFNFNSYVCATYSSKID